MDGIDAVVPAPTPAPAPATAAAAEPNRTQPARPSIAFNLIVLLLLIWLISKEGSTADQHQLDETTEAIALEQMTLLNQSILARDGLETWLQSNASQSMQISLPAIVDSPVKLLMQRDETIPALYHQNLTGFIKGDWHGSLMTFEELGLNETYNVTAYREPSTLSSQNESEARSVKRQLDDAVTILNSTLNETTSLPLVAYNMTMNRTVLQGDPHSFDWRKGGKIMFDLREEQSSAVVGNDSVNLEGSRVMQVLRSDADEEWKKRGPVTYLRGDVHLFIKDSTDDFLFNVEGVHFLDQGTFYASLIPSTLSISKLLEIPESTMLDNSSRSLANGQAAGRVILKEMDRRIEARKEIVEEGKGEVVAPVESTGSPCSFVLYGAMSPFTPQYSLASYSEYIASVFHPTGSSVPAPAPAIVSYIMYSDCGLVIEGKGETISSMRLWARATNMGTVLVFTQGILVCLLVRQMESGNMPVRISFLTIMFQAGMDCYFFLILFTVGTVTNNRSSLCLLVSAFLAVVSSLLFGMRYTAIIRLATPSRPSPPPPPPPPPVPTLADLAANAAEPRAEGEEESESAVLLPVAVPPRTVVRVPGELTDSSEDERLYLGILGFFFIGSFFIIFRYGWVPLVIITLYSYWVPQILLNITRGAARLSLSREFIIGTTLCRLVLPMYIWGCPQNVLMIEPSLWAVALFVYSIAQATILLLQDYYTPSFFVPQPVLDRFNITDEQIWNYHPFLSPHDIESQCDRKEDCAICMEPIVFPGKEERELGALGKARWEYMVPPCHHIAHTQCLSSWLQIKSVCPTCRRPLPAL